MENSRDTSLEQAYLSQVLDIAQAQFDEAAAGRQAHATALRTAQEELLERGSMDIGGFGSEQGFADMLDMSGDMADMRDSAAAQQDSDHKILALTRMLDSPYFARIDFQQAGGALRQVYIGRSTLMDEDTMAFYVYDWRTPVASLFYRYGTGAAHYDAPGGRIEGDITLKRQHEIRRGKMLYFFDADTQVSDAFLRQMLARPASTAMKSIVETIQRDQDRVIRDLSSRLLMVQGVAGSGKTSVALHRVAFLMYEGLKADRLAPGEMLVIAPNAAFERYIEQVLPDLGESQVRTILFEELLNGLLPDAPVQPRSAWVEAWLSSRDEQARAQMREVRTFLGSRALMTMLDRLVDELPQRWLPFADIDYDGQCVMRADAMLETVCDSGKIAPIGVRLGMLERQIWREIHTLRPARREKLLKEAQADPLHYTEAVAYARMRSIEESGVLLDAMRTFTRVDCVALYRRLFDDEAAFLRLSEGLLDAAEANRLRVAVRKGLDGDMLPYSDAAAVAYLQARVYGHRAFRHIRQLVVDEVQDMDALHITLLGMLFPRAKYTLLGDVYQSLQGAPNPGLYAMIREALAQPDGTLVTLDKSFRCTREIWDFSAQFLPPDAGGESFSRHGDPVLLHGTADEKTMDALLVERIADAQEAGLRTVACLCKTAADARALHARLRKSLPVKLVDNDDLALVEGVAVVPLYMAKGLEFDAVMLCDVDDAHYHDEGDKDLLYTGCTRALHRLELFWQGTSSALIMERGGNDGH